MRAHLSLNVRSVPESIAFYQKVFGQEPQKQTPTYAKFDLKEPSLNFAMQEARDRQSLSRVSHLGIEVQSAEEVKSWTEKLQSLGIKTMSEEGTDCCYALQDKVWFQDPDGNHWEVFFVHAQLPTEGAQPPKADRKSCAPGVGCC